MEQATLTSKSQITLPKAVREQLGVGPGDTVHFVPSWNGWRLVVRKGDITRLRGMFKGRAGPTTLEQMDEAIAAAVIERDQRSRRR